MSSEMNFAFTAQDFKPLEFSPVKWGGPAVTSLSIGEEGDAITVDEKPVGAEQKIPLGATPPNVITNVGGKEVELPQVEHKEQKTPVANESSPVATHDDNEQGVLFKTLPEGGPHITSLAGGEEGDPIYIEQEFIFAAPQSSAPEAKFDLIGKLSTIFDGGYEPQIKVDAPSLYGDDDLVLTFAPSKDVAPSISESKMTLETVIASHDSFAELIDSAFPTSVSKIDDAVVAVRDLTAHVALETHDLNVLDQFNALV